VGGGGGLNVAGHKKRECAPPRGSKITASLWGFFLQRGGGEKRGHFFLFVTEKAIGLKEEVRNVATQKKGEFSSAEGGRKPKTTRGRRSPQRNERKEKGYTTTFYY